MSGPGQEPNSLATRDTDGCRSVAGGGGAGVAGGCEQNSFGK